MRCPYCDYAETRVLDSRAVEEGRAIRRRRECAGCGRRFTTYERIEEMPLTVVKKDGRRELFNRRKLLTGLTKACEKRPISLARLEELTAEIETEVRNRAVDGEVRSRDIGELVMTKLRDLDEVAYVRFASVYREFRDIEGFRQEIEQLLRRRSRDE